MTIESQTLQSVTGTTTLTVQVVSSGILDRTGKIGCINFLAALQLLQAQRVLHFSIINKHGHNPQTKQISKHHISTF